MTDCKFKIGETYKDRDGRAWELVARNDAYAFPLVFRLKGHQDFVAARCLDGKVVANMVHAGDILPNRKREWLVTWVHAGTGNKHEWFGTEVSARSMVRNLKSLATNWDLVSDIRGPFLWEESE